jgi:thiol:disulfide interchange protein DsbD
LTVLGHVGDVRFVQKLLSWALLWLVCVSAQAAHTKVSLVLGTQTARAGDTVLAGVRCQMEPGWHIYWSNSGGPGLPTKIEWQLPAGVTAEPTQWPLPEKLAEKEFTTYIYKDEVVLLTPLKLKAGLPAGPIQIKAAVSWLECDVQCILGRESIEATLTIGTENKASEAAPMLSAWQKKVPLPGEAVSARGWWENAGTNDQRPFIIEWNNPSAATEADFFPDASDEVEVQPATERLPSDAGKIRLRVQVKKLSGDWPAKIAGVVIQQSGTSRAGYAVKLGAGTSSMGATEKEPASSGAAGTAALSDVGGAAPPFWRMLLYAFIGGLILNIMPCVLPVIALKILGFVSQSKDHPRRVRRLGLIYASGVLVSFLVLAGLVIGVKAAGHKAGWGMQFSNPQFLVVLTVLVTLVALNLFGLFEVNPGGRVLGAAGSLAAKHGAGGAFFNGVLATVLATPCTAPYLATALGFAFAQPAAVLTLMLLTAGLGLAAPYVVLSWDPSWLKFLPAPGAWMEKFKIAMGFPMLATAMWLFSLLPIHYGDRAWWFGIFLVIVAFAAWIFGQFVQHGNSRRCLALGLTVGLLVLGYFGVLEAKLHWRVAEPVSTSRTTGLSSDGMPWQSWSRAAVASARASGRPVLVDFTAKWCFNCNVLVKPVLESTSVRKKLQEYNAAALLADYTLFPGDITEELRRFGRAGVPLVVVFPRDPQQPPIVLPAIPTPGMILKALETANR